MKLINRTDIKQRILWFSDIHFLEDDVEDYLSVFLKKFFKICKRLNDDQEINYVIISGDLTNKGTEIEFKNFTKHIITPLFKSLKNSKLLTIPGNHDLSINNPFDYERFRIINKPKNRKTRSSYFKNDTDYKSFFNNYTKFCRKNIKYFPKITPPYATDFLYGYYKDEKNKMLFILINSSWLSLSVKLLEHFLQEEYLMPFRNQFKEIYYQIESFYDELRSLDGNKKKNIDTNEIINLINNSKENIIKIREGFNVLKSLLTKINEELTEKAYDISYQTIEYGTQELFLNFMEMEESIGNLIEFLEKNSNFFIISILHHPENHLTWNERIGSNSLFTYLKKKSDVVLSSHEHVPKDFLQIFNINETLHLKSGPFIELKFIKEEKDRPTKNQFDYFNESNLEKSTFSILDINVTKKKVTENRYAYNTKDTEWHKLNFPKDNSTFLLPHDTILPNHSRIEEIYTKIRDIDNFKLVEKIVNTNFKLNEIKDTIYSFNDNLIILNQKSNFDNLGDEFLKNLIIENNFKKVFFYSIDIMITTNKDDPEAFLVNKYYTNQNLDQESALGKLKKEVFKNFNEYRAKFFNAFSIDDSKKIENVSFILILIPFWEIERILPP